MVSEESLEWLRIDGKLTFATGKNTRLVAETIGGAPGSVVSVGTATNPIAADVTAEILIDTTGGPLSLAEDPTLISRGMILHGTSNIYGADKSDFTGLSGDARTGDSVIELSDAQVPAGWRVGDTLLLVGTSTDVNASTGEPVSRFDEGSDRYVEAHRNNERFHDELLRITGIEELNERVRIRFDNITNDASIAAGSSTLLWDHVRPDGATFDASELTINVANLTRNVIVRSSDPNVDIQERGHFMVMHNRDANVHNAQFKDLGRTDKRLIIDDPPGRSFDGSDSFGTNPRGRYGLHLHRVARPA